MQQVVYWHNVIRPCPIDKTDSEFPVLGRGESGWLLLQQIRSMAPGRRVSFQDAWRIAFAEAYRQMWADNMEAGRVGSSTWIMSNTVRWLSLQGYQVELTGMEFELLEESVPLESAA